MLPIIIQLSVLLVSILATLFALGVDLLDKGCLTWHRDSVGFLLQTVIATICILVTAVHLKSYIEQYEVDDDISIGKCSNINILYTFVVICINLFSAILLFRS